ncbi:MAG: tRNA-intron lyase [Halococcoides sp.]
MNLRFEGALVRGGREARERFHDSRGYGRADDGAVVLAPVEVAHLLARGDVDRIEGQTVTDLLAGGRVSLAHLAVYADLRNRGFYLTPGRLLDADADFVVYPRGSGPWDDAVAYRIDVIDERDTLRPDAGVIAVVDEEGEVSYVEIERREPSGTVDRVDATLAGRRVEDRVLVADPPAGVHERSFYGQPMPGGIDGIGLSLLEAIHLAATDRLALDGVAATPDSGATDPAATLRAVGRDLGGERFDRRLAAYRALRTAGIAPKTGYKFGADFRTYAAIETVEDLGHSEWLVRVRPADRPVAPREIALDVRMAHGVRKTMVHALVPDDPAPEAIEWLAIERLTP